MLSIFYTNLEASVYPIFLIILLMVITKIVYSDAATDSFDYPTSLKTRFHKKKVKKHKRELKK